MKIYCWTVNSSFLCRLMSWRLMESIMVCAFLDCLWNLIILLPYYLV